MEKTAQFSARSYHLYRQHAQRSLVRFGIQEFRTSPEMPTFLLHHLPTGPYYGPLPRLTPAGARGSAEARRVTVWWIQHATRTLILYAEMLAVTSVALVENQVGGEDK